LILVFIDADKMKYIELLRTVFRIIEQKWFNNH
jgi:hypothetical protein